MNIINEAISKEKEYNNEVSYFSNNEDETSNQIINSTINHINNNNNINELQKKYPKIIARY